MNLPRLGDWIRRVSARGRASGSRSPVVPGRNTADTSPQWSLGPSNWCTQHQHPDMGA